VHVTARLDDLVKVTRYLRLRALCRWRRAKLGDSEAQRLAECSARSRPGLQGSVA